MKGAERAAAEEPVGSQTSASSSVPAVPAPQTPPGKKAWRVPLHDSKDTSEVPNFLPYSIAMAPRGSTAVKLAGNSVLATVLQVTGMRQTPQLGYHRSI